MENTPYDNYGNVSDNAPDDPDDVSFGSVISDYVEVLDKLLSDKKFKEEREKKIKLVVKRYIDKNEEYLNNQLF